MAVRLEQPGRSALAGCDDARVARPGLRVLVVVCGTQDDERSLASAVALGGDHLVLLRCWRDRWHAAAGRLTAAARAIAPLDIPLYEADDPEERATRDLHRTARGLPSAVPRTLVCRRGSPRQVVAGVIETCRCDTLVAAAAILTPRFAARLARSAPDIRLITS